MNTIDSLCVHVDASPRSGMRLALARQLATRCGARRIEAMYCRTPCFADLPLAYGAGAAGAPAFLDDLYEQRYQRARQLFDKENAGHAMQWREIANDAVVPAMAGRALYADLMVLGQHQPDDLDTLNTPADFVPAVLIDSGKPAVVLPYAGSFGAIGERVLIAWKPTREAARALAAAMPILQRASSVHLVTDAGRTAAIADLEACLRAHGVEAPLKQHAPLPETRPGESLLSLAADCDADLVVMGCYGHSRAREWVMGGATRTVLASMTLPVLMAH